MKGLLLPLFLGLAFPVGAQTPKTTLWRISGADTLGASYLFGTVHSRDDRAYQWGDSVAPALQRVQLVAGELDLAADQRQMMGMLSQVRIPNGGTLKELYKKKEWKRVEAGLRTALGPMHVLAHTMKPYFVLLLLAGTEVAGTHERVLDDELQRAARERGQEVLGLETMLEQLSAMDVLPLDRQAQLLLQQIDETGNDEELEDLLDAYAAQDLDLLMATMERSTSMPPEMNTSLIVDRNARMAMRMDSIMRSGTTAFFAVGAAHLPGNMGLIALLRERGYGVVPVISAFTKPEAPQVEQEEDK